MILRNRQKRFVERSLSALDEYGNTLGVAPTGCHAPGTPILLRSGHTKLVEDIRVGDRLMGPDSQPRTVLELHRGQDEMFEVRPKFGAPFVVNEGHILSLANGQDVINLSVGAYFQKRPAFKRLYKLYRAGVDFPLRAPTEIDSYVMGLLISDRCLLSGPSIITDEYKLASRYQRQALLAGLIDMDGQVSGRSIVFYNASNTLINDIAFVARSLGFLAETKWQRISGSLEFIVTISGDFRLLPVRQSEKKPAFQIYRKNSLRTDFTVRPVGKGDYMGFSVDKDHLYLMGDFTVTHNSHILKGRKPQWG